MSTKIKYLNVVIGLMVLYAFNFAALYIFKLDEQNLYLPPLIISTVGFYVVILGVCFYLWTINDNRETKQQLQWFGYVIAAMLAYAIVYATFFKSIAFYTIATWSFNVFAASGIGLLNIKNKVSVTNKLRADYLLLAMLIITIGEGIIISILIPLMGENILIGYIFLGLIWSIIAYLYFLRAKWSRE